MRHLRREMRGTRTRILGGVEGVEEAVEGGGEQERQQDVGDEDAGEEDDAGGGEHAEAGVEGCALAEGLAGPSVSEQHQQQDGEGLAAGGWRRC